MVSVVDVSPVRSRTTFTFDRFHQSVSGKALCVAMSADGKRLYLGGHSGVWRSEDGGASWSHSERPQPPTGSTSVTGALLPPAVYDLAISPSNPDVVLAATGRDSRSPSQNGIYRSTDGARSWTRVHQFASGGSFGTVGSLTVAPDNSRLMFAGGQFAVGISTDRGATWSETRPNGPGQSVFYVVASRRQPGGVRHVFAVGTRVWRSRDGGATWITDPAALGAGAPADGLGQCARCVAADPTNARRIYLARSAGELWRGVAPATGNGAMTWTMLVPPKTGFGGTTASGTDFVLVHRAPDRTKQLIFSDRRTVHVSIGDPTGQSSWRRIDGTPVHVDPHGAAVTRDADLGHKRREGRIVMVNDGGAVVSTNGGHDWDFGNGPSTLGLVNTAVLPRRDRPPGLVIQMGDNNGFFSADGGEHWKTQDYRGGDNDCSFADPAQPHRLLVFAPRFGDRSIFLYRANVGQIANGAAGTGQRKVIPSPPPLAGETKGAWNAVSSHYNLGYRPLVLTLAGETPPAGGDFVTIVRSSDGSGAQLMRTTKLHLVTSSTHWVTGATTDGPSVKAFRQGPQLPNTNVSVVQASGGHGSPTFYVGDQNDATSQRVWSWRAGQSTWRQIVPATPPGPQRARRFFVDPYRPRTLYVLDAGHVWRTENGGRAWTIDSALEDALTEQGSFPIGLTSEVSSAQALLRDMVFDPDDPRWRAAVGPAGVFLTLDGRAWRHLLLSSAAAMRPNNAVLDKVSHPCARMLYVSTSNRGVLRLGPLPPDWEAMPGGVSAALGKITLLRVHDVGSGFGPPGDQLDAEVVVQLDSEPGRSFGLQMRTDADRDANDGMFELLRAAFDRSRPVRIEYIRTSCSMGVIFRVILQ